MRNDIYIYILPYHFHRSQVICRNWHNKFCLALRQNLHCRDSDSSRMWKGLVAFSIRGIAQNRMLLPFYHHPDLLLCVRR